MMQDDPFSASRMKTILGSGPLLLPSDQATRPLRQRVLEQIRAFGQISRSDLAKALRISPATVSAIVTGLVSDDLVTEIESAPAITDEDVRRSR